MCMMLMPLLSLGLGVAQAVAQNNAQQEAADRQNQYYLQNAQAAQRAAINTYAAQQNKIIQERNAASQEGLETKIAALRGRATAQTASGEAGVSGLSTDALIQDYYGREGRRLESIDSNYQMNSDYLRAEMLSTHAQAEARINSVQRAQPPSFADAALRIAGAAVGALGKMGGSGGSGMSMNFAT